MGQRILLVGAECLWFESNVERSTETRRRQMPIRVSTLYRIYIHLYSPHFSTYKHCWLSYGLARPTVAVLTGDRESHGMVGDTKTLGQTSEAFYELDFDIKRGCCMQSSLAVYTYIVRRHIIFTARCYAYRWLCCRKMSVCPSIYPSVTPQYSVERAKHIKLFLTIG